MVICCQGRWASRDPARRGRRVSLRADFIPIISIPAGAAGRKQFGFAFHFLLRISFLILIK